MNISHITLYDDLLKQSLKIPTLVTQSENKDSAFLTDFIQWLTKTEGIMKHHNLAKCSEVAGLRSKIIAEGYSNESKLSKKKRQLSTAISIICEAQRNLLDVIEPIGSKIQKSREAIRQLLNVAYQANMINMALGFNQMIPQLWSSFLLHEQLKGATVRILALINRWCPLLAVQYHRVHNPLFYRPNMVC